MKEDIIVAYRHSFKHLTLAVWVSVMILPACTSVKEGAAVSELRPVARGPRSMDTWLDLGIGPLSLRLANDSYSDIEGQKIHQHLRNIVAVSEQSRRDGVKLWGRICGPKYERMAADYVRSKFEHWGLEQIEVKSFPRVAQWWPTDWEVTLVGGSSAGAPAEDQTLTSAFPALTSLAARSSGTTAPEGFEAEVVDIGLGREVDLRGKDLAGKIALVRSFPTPSPLAHTAFGIAERLEQTETVAGLITTFDIPGNFQTAALSVVSPKFPCFTATREDGLLLDDVLGKSDLSNPPRIRMRLSAETEEGMTAQNVYGVLRGSTDEYVIVIAHLDGWFDGALDNASGVATMLALAEHFAKQPRAQRKRNIMFVGTAGHHARSPGTAYMVKHQRELLDKTVFVLNSEHTASVWHTRWGTSLRASNTESPKELAITNQSPLLLQVFKEAIDRYGVVTMTSTGTPDWARGDPIHFTGVTPVVGFIEAPLMYHTTGDPPEYVPAEGLERTTRAFAYFLDQVDRVSREEIEKGAKPMAAPMPFGRGPISAPGAIALREGD